MPTFDFHCRDCKEMFEATVPFGCRKFPPCPACSSANVEKKLSPPAGIVFKGSGFYKTDSRGKRSDEGHPTSLADSELRRAGEGGRKDSEDGKESKDTAKSTKVDLPAKGSAGASKNI